MEEDKDEVVDLINEYNKDSIVVRGMLLLLWLTEVNLMGQCCYCCCDYYKLEYKVEYNYGCCCDWVE